MENGFNKEEINDLKNALINITNNLILTSPISIKEDLQTNKHLALSKKEKEELLKNREDGKDPPDVDRKARHAEGRQGQDPVHPARGADRGRMLEPERQPRRGGARPGHRHPA